MTSYRLVENCANIFPIDTGPEEYKDAPVAVQVVGYRHRDEALIKVAETLNSIINKS